MKEYAVLFAVLVSVTVLAACDEKDNSVQAFQEAKSNEPKSHPDGTRQEQTIEFLGNTVPEIATAAGAHFVAFGRVTDPGKLGGRWAVFVDCVEQRLTHIPVKNSFVCGPRGKRFAFATREDDLFRVVVDGKAGPSFSDIYKGVFSRSGRRYTYIAIRGKMYYCVVDNIEYGPYPNIGINGVVFSPDEKHAAFIVIRGNRQHLCVDGVESKGFEGVDKHITYSADSKHVAVLVVDSSKRKVLLDDFEGEPFDLILPHLALSKSGNRLAYSTQQNGAWFMCDGGKLGDSWQSVFHPVLDSAGEHLAYFVSDQRTQQFQIVRDGKKGPPYRHVLNNDVTIIENPAFSPSGRHLAYCAGPGKDVLYMIEDDKLNGPYKSVLGYWYPPQQESLTFVAQDDKGFSCWSGGNQGKHYKKIRVKTLCFSPDGRHVAYCADSARGEYETAYDVLILDGAEPLTEGSITRIGFNEEGSSLEYIREPRGRVKRYTRGVVKLPK